MGNWEYVGFVDKKNVIRKHGTMEKVGIQSWKKLKVYVRLINH